MIVAFAVRFIRGDWSAVSLGVALPGGEVLDGGRFHVRLRVIAPFPIKALLQAEVIFRRCEEWVALRKPSDARIERLESDLLHLFSRLTERQSGLQAIVIPGNLPQQTLIVLGEDGCGASDGTTGPIGDIRDSIRGFEPQQAVLSPLVSQVDV